jgi:2',3'-cyclic-nucleotide 2'-phosphodiesterase (5'-nucleotidase family)/uncharacterized protein YjiK
MKAIQAHAAKWGLQPHKAKRPGEQSDQEEKLAQDSNAAQVGAEVLDASTDVVLSSQAGMEAMDGITHSGAPVQLASLSGVELVAQAGGTSAASGSAAAVAAAQTSVATASSAYLPLAMVLGGMGLVVASGRSSAQTPTTKGKLIDGYIAGATVFVDLNKNGQLDTGEASAVSDAQGNFTLPQGLNGPIVAVGGRDISTGLDFTGVLKAPAGSTTVTPLTTLVNELMTSSGLSATAAQDRVLDAVGLSALKGQVDLTKLDPVAGAAAGTPGALDLQKAGVMVATMVSSLTVKVQQTAGAGVGVDKHDEIASGIFAQVASTLTGATTGQLSASQIAATASTVVSTLAAQATPSVGGVSFNGDNMKAASVSALENLSAFASKVASADTVDALATNQKTALTNTTYRLQLLHFADAEAGLLASSTAPKLAALVDKFEDAYANSITLAGGDNFIPGPFMAAGTDPSLLSLLGVPGNRGNIEIGALDIAIHNKIGVSASALGNHEFDLGSNALAAAFRPGTGSPGADFVYLSANLDFAADSALNPHFVNTVATAGLEEASSLKGKIAPSAIITEGGAKIGLVGATTQLLESISSPSGTKVKDNDSVRSNDMDLLAQQLQPVIDDLIAQGVNKIILMSHLQVLDNEKLLATKLKGVDIILAAGSNTRLGDANDTAVAFAGHDAKFADTYPLMIQDKEGKNTLVVNTDNEFTYLGRLVVDFDANGHIIPSSLNTTVNGAYAATDANVAAAWGTSAEQLTTTAYASGTRGGQVKALTDAVQTVINVKDGNIYGYADVYLEGERIAVRNQETNLGSLSADANAYALEQALGSAAAQTFIVSVKNGGGIRAQIGAISAPKTDGTVDKLPPEGGVSQLDVENSLRFNNQLMAFDTTPAGLKAILEHGVAALGSQGRFPQLGGVSFSYDPDLAVGSRVSDIALVDDGYRVNLYNDGTLLAGAPAKITVVTLNFLAQGGDSYPIKANGENFRYLVEQTGGGFALTAPVDETKNFTETDTIKAAVGTSTLLGEQRAFEVYMKAFHATPQTAYKQAETAESLDTRIQNLNVRAEDVLAPQLSFTAPGESMDLANYTLVGRFALPAEPTAANKLAHEASAVTYNKDTDTLFVVGDGGTGVTQVSKQGVLIDSMALATGSSPQGTYFYDTEGLAYIGNGRFVMVEERDRELNEFTYVAGSTLGANSAVRTVKLGTSIGNVGLEGLGLDPLSSGFLLAKEASPMGVFQTSVDFAAGTASNGSATTENSVNLFDPAKAGLVSVNDIYALSNVLDATAAEAAHLLLLGAADGKVLEMDRSGNILSTLNVGSMAKNEGLTMGTDRRLYVVGEEGGGSLDKPELLVFAPTTGREAVGLGSHLYLGFNSQVSAGTGAIVISNGKGDTRNIDVTDATQVKITGSSVKIDPAADLASGQTYTVTFASGVFKDASNAARVALTGETLSFKTVGDVLPPQLTATSPVDNAFGVTSHHTILTFSEAVKAGSGNIVLRGQNAGGLSDVRSIPVTDLTQVTIFDKTVDINPSADLFNGYSYAVEVPAGAITDLAGNAFPGLASQTSLTFTRNSGAVAGPQTVIISEVNSDASPADFFELYNYGSEPVALDGWKWDDDSSSFTDVAAASFPVGTTIAAGARLLVASATDATAFKAAWGLAADVQVVAAGGPGLGKGDSVVVFNQAAQAVTALNYGLIKLTASDGTSIAVSSAATGVVPATIASHAGTAFGATDKVSVVWDGVSTSAPAYRPAVVGQLGGFSQANAAANIGSPGLIAAAQATDTTAPTLVSAMPVAGSSSALASSNIILSLSESVKAGTGNILLVNAADASDTRTIAVTDATQVSFSSGLVTINPSADLRAGASYSVQMAAGVIDDLAGNDFAGLAGNQALAFSVAASTPRLLITELNSNAGPADFFEILNYGDAAVSLQGWKWDDDSASFADGVAIGNVSIPAGGTLVVASTAASTLATFKTTWGLADNVQVITSEGPGLGGADAVVLFNDAGSVVTSFNYSGSTKIATDGSTIGLSAGSQGVTFVPAVHAGPAFGGTAGANGVSAVWDGASLSAPSYRAAQVGVDGGLAQSANAANIGSPGIVPALPVAPSNAGLAIDNLSISAQVVAPAAPLGVGDLVFLGANADATDAFAFAILKDIAAGTKIGFTDRNYSELTGMPATGESAFIWSADQNYAAGTIVTIQSDVAKGTNPLADKGMTQGAGGGLSGSGETVYAFLGEIADLATGSAGAVSVTQLLASLNVGGDAAGDVPASIDATSLNLSSDNARYNGSFDFNDLPAFLLAADNPANWQTSDTVSFALANNSLFIV